MHPHRFIHDRWSLLICQETGGWNKHGCNQSIHPERDSPPNKNHTLSLTHFNSAQFSKIPGRTTEEHLILVLILPLQVISSMNTCPKICPSVLIFLSRPFIVLWRLCFAARHFLMRGLLLSSSLLPIHGGLSKPGNYPSTFIFVPIATKLLSKHVT